MSDFVAVLKRTLDGLGETTPEIRKRVYDKARSTISAKLEAMNPPPSSTVATRQRRSLEDAIAEVEASYSRTVGKNEPLDELEQVLNSLNGLKNQTVIPAARSTPPRAEPAPARTEQPPKPARVEPVTPRPMATPRPINPEPRTASPETPAVLPGSRPAPTLPTPRAQETRPETPRTDPRPPVVARSPEPRVQEQQAPAALPPADFDDFDDFDAPIATRNDRFDAPLEPLPTKRRGGFGKYFVSAIVLAAIAAGGYFTWQNRERVQEMASSWMPSGSTVTPSKPTPTEPETPSPTTPTPSTPVPTTPTTAEPTANPPTEPPANTPAPVVGPTKFTQKLNADGTETDLGPAGGDAPLAEGTSVAPATVAPGQATPAPATQEPAPGAQTPPAPTPGPETPAVPTPAEGQPPAEATETNPPAGEPQTPAAAPGGEATPAQAQPASPAAPAAGSVAVAQKAIFYEERTSNLAGSAEAGNIVWSVVQESPGGDLPPEPAIRGEATIPGKNLQLRMTIRRNADKTLPAAQIIEMIFLTGPNFDGGSVANVLRVALKTSEQDPGTPLTGIPAKISDGFFLVALSDVKAESANNAQLMEQRNWLDIPMVYQSGRRALITIEKGVPGEKIFQDVIKTWGVTNG